MSDRGYPDGIIPGWLHYQPRQAPPSDQRPLPPGAPWFASLGIARVERGRTVWGYLTRDTVTFVTGEMCRWPPLFRDEGGPL